MVDVAQARAEQLAGIGLTPQLVADADNKVVAAEAVIAGPRNHIIARRAHTEHIRLAVTKLERLLNYTLAPGDQPPGSSRARRSRRRERAPRHARRDATARRVRRDGDG